jgi:hypothetical protein
VSALVLVTGDRASGLTCAESGATPGVVESVLAGEHPRAARWEVIASGSVTAVRPIAEDYGSNGADVSLTIDAWFRGGSTETTLVVFDPPRGSAGVGFEVGRSYLVFASRNLGWDGRLATGLCDLTFELSPARRAELVSAFGPSIPDSATDLPTWDLTALGLLALAGAFALITWGAARERR